MPEDKQGTGKHPHKSTEEPYPHHESGRGGQSESGRGGQSETRSGGGKNEGSSSESKDLKEREYGDNKGEIHHHTHTYEEQHKK